MQIWILRHICKYVFLLFWAALCALDFKLCKLCFKNELLKVSRTFNFCVKKRRIWSWFQSCLKRCTKNYLEKVRGPRKKKSLAFTLITYFVGDFSTFNRSRISFLFCVFYTHFFSFCKTFLMVIFARFATKKPKAHDLRTKKANKLHFPFPETQHPLT